MKSKKINVLHIASGNLNQGAARGAYWLHLGILKNGVDSYILNNGVIDGSNYINVININTSSKLSKTINFIKSRLDIYIKKIYPKSRREIFSTGLFGYNFLKTKQYKEADIIHMHWINGGMVNINVLNKIDKPIIWTIRDMWPFTGGCHYALHCDNYINKCFQCHFLGSNSNNDLSTYLFNRKKRIYAKSNFTVVGISNWIAKLARESSLFSKINVQMIYNNIDSKRFKPYPKEFARIELGLQTSKKVILVGAINAKNVWKGFQFLKDAMLSLDKNKYVLCTFGKINTADFEEIPQECRHFGFVNDDILLSKIYSASDVFISMSIQEAFGKTVVESMSCKTPVVCFDNSGPGELVDHKINGYLAEASSSRGITEGVEWIANSEDYEMLRENAREKVTQDFDNEIIAKKYIELYKRKLE